MLICHVYCGQRGEPFCGAELESVKEVVNDTARIRDLVIEGDYDDADAVLRGLRGQIHAARLAGMKRKRS